MDLSALRARLPALVLLPFLSLFALTPCGKNEPTQPTSAPAAGGLHFLMADQGVLSEVVIGTDQRHVLLKYDDLSTILDPALSPDGKQIAFVRQVPTKALPNGKVDYGADLYVMNRDGSNARMLVEHKGIGDFLGSPAWAPRGRQILYSVYGQGPSGSPDLRVESVDLQTNTTSRMISPGVDPVVSPDGKHLAYTVIDTQTGENHLVYANIDGTDGKTIVPRDSGLGLISSVVFSPDGARIAFAAVDQALPAPGKSSRARARQAQVSLRTSHPYAQDVWIVDGDGTNLHRLADIAENMPSLSWTGDGKSLYALGPGSLWRIDPSTGDKQQIAPGVAQAQIIWLAG